MPNIAEAFKSEVARLSKKFARQDLQAIKTATTAQRRQLAALKKQLAALEREVAALRRTAGSSKKIAAEPTAGGSLRFVAKGLRSLRSRLGLSAGDLGLLIGVSAQSVYNWEAEKTVPRAAQVAAIAALRSIGKKEAQARLEQLSAKQ